MPSSCLRGPAAPLGARRCSFFRDACDLGRFTTVRLVDLAATGAVSLLAGRRPPFPLDFAAAKMLRSVPALPRWRDVEFPTIDAADGAVLRFGIARRRFAFFSVFIVPTRSLLAACNDMRKGRAS
jgi:hypothetical protein